MSTLSGFLVDTSMHCRKYLSSSLAPVHVEVAISTLNRSVAPPIGLCAVVACSLRPNLVADDRTFNGFVRSNRLRKMARCPRIGYRNRARVVPDPAKETSADRSAATMEGLGQHPARFRCSGST